MHKPLAADPEPFPSLPEPFVSLPRDCCLSTGICSAEHTETVQKRVHSEHRQAFLFAISSQHFLFSPEEGVDGKPGQLGRGAVYKWVSKRTLASGKRQTLKIMALSFEVYGEGCVSELNIHPTSGAGKVEGYS